ncbi:transcription elongation factor Spt5 [Massarina eburnea CBS 473.64]|uniref:Transcription elongation factor SPT5 n=1 Tax=Massarina eburnea CBS 473.64 TaxID=1395130 RepID=A0A6A6S843_9PLEO|nr:transcription elongation factor Spt5 [Massarina eburnea CBS 473.64]
MSVDYQSESDDDGFNPAPEVDDEEMAQNDATTHDDDETAAPGRQSDNEDDEDNEENEDDEDEEEDEEDEDVVNPNQARPAKRRKKRANMFIDVEAEVDEEEDEEEDDNDEIVDEVHPDDLLEPTGADLDDRHHRQFDMQRQVQADKDAEQIAKEYDEKYRRREAQSARRGAYGAVHAPAPSVSDPNIWAVKVRPGKEREVVMAIQKRMDEAARAGQRAKIYSAFERGGTMSGYLYVEADAKQDMVEVIENIPNVFMGQGQMAIEVKERQDLLRKRQRTPLEEGKFVRMLRPPLYKGDLAKVVEVHQNGLDCTVQLVPRLDYGLGEDANAAVDNKRKRPAFGRNVERPPQKLFNDSEARKKHMKFLTQVGAGNQRAFTYKNEDYQNGFLLKEVKVNYVTSENVNPRMEEMQFFSVTAADGTETLDLLAVQAAQKAATSGSAFVSGDTVEIYEGEQKGLRGTTVTVTGDIVSIKVTEGDLKGRRIDAPVRTLRKLFRDGDHVKVIGGSKYIDEVGMITRIKGDKVTLLCDSTQTEIVVFSKDLKRAADSATLGDESKYNIYDMVQIDNATIGMVVKVDREVLRVLDQNGNPRTLLHTQVTDHFDNNRNAVATDRDGSEIRKDDTVKEHGGENRQGKVHHIHRGALFVTNREILENAGVWVVRSANVVTMAAKSGRTQAAGPDLSGMNPAMQNQNGGVMPPPTTRPQFGRDKLIGKTVTIRKGNYKGLLGIVKDTMNDEARIELHTKNKQVTVKKDILTIKDPLTGNTIDVGGSRFPNRSRGGYSGATPSQNGPSWGNSSRSSNGPSWGGATPSGGRTPGWGGGGRTAYGGATSYGGATAYGGDGSRTAYGGDGSRTAYGGATAYGGNDGSRTAYGGFNSGSRTPGWGASSSTTASKSNLSAPTPGAYNPPTPAPYSAPTPGAYGAYSAPTPGGPPMDAPTPGNFTAPTPGDTTGQYNRGYGGYAAPTPAAAPTPGAWAETPGMDDDPRYD